MNTLSKRTFNLVLGGIMVAMATVLGFLKLWEAPYGGSITVCSMLPILFFSYRCGLKWGLGAGLVNSALQLLLGMSALAFTLGSFVAMMLRYFCSFLSGWLLWSALNEATYMQEVIATYIPGLANVSGTTLAVVYSLVYNGVYMIPEIILTCVVGFLLVQFAGKQVLDKPADVKA